MTIIYAAFIMGLLGSLHCAGMCGPIAMIVSGKSRWSFLGNRLIYNAGRIVTYASLGALIGLVGEGIALAGWQQGMSILVGSLIIIGVILSIKNKHIPSFVPIQKMVGKTKQMLGVFIKKRTLFSSFMIGLLNGFLPCGLTYMALFASLATASILNSTYFMMAFGLGTVPMLLVMAFGGGAIVKRFNLNVAKIVPVFILVMGIMLVLRGMNLGIPYLSPELISGTEVLMGKDVSVCK
ncbi:MAG: sulfite exporter TauE/SafE family protein [Bacteroidota bacterium]